MGLENFRQGRLTKEMVCRQLVSFANRSRKFHVDSLGFIDFGTKLLVPNHTALFGIDAGGQGRCEMAMEPTRDGSAI